MKQRNIFLIGLAIALSIQASFSQTKPVASKAATSKSTVASASAKAPVKAVLPQVEIAQQIAKGQSEFSLLGNYAIYAGVQKTNIGHFTLAADGTYKVTVKSDENSYGTGFYEYDAVNKSLVWKGGLFASNGYKGSIKKLDNGGLQVQLSKSTFAEKIN